MNNLSRYWNVLALGLITGAAAVGTALGEDNTASEDSAFIRFCKQDYLLGDWGGLRTKLKDRGVDFEFVYFGGGTRKS